MRAVSNPSPLSNLASMDRLPVLQAQFSEIFIPRAVEQELAAHPDPAARAWIQAAMQAEWIKLAVSTF